MQTAADTEAAGVLRHREAWWQRVLGFVRRKPLGGFGLIVLILLVFSAVFAEAIATHDPVATEANRTLEAPSRDHYFGTVVSSHPSAVLAS